MDANFFSNNNPNTWLPSLSFINVPYGYIEYNTLADYAFNDVHYDKNDNIYVATNRGGVAFSSDNGLTWRNINTSNGLRSNNTFAVTTDSYGRVLVGTRFGFSISNDSYSFSTYNSDDGLGIGGVTYPNYNRIFIDNSGRVYINSDRGFGFTDNLGGSFTSKGAGDGIPNMDTSGGTVQDSLGNIYVGTSNGLAISTDNAVSFTVRNTGDGLASNNILSIAIDSNDRIFVGTNSGISISTDGGTSFTNVTTADGLGSNAINELYIDNSDILYVGTTSGLSKSTDNGISFTNVTSGLPSPVVNAIDMNSAGTLLIGTSTGLATSSDGGLTFTTIADVSSPELLASQAYYTVKENSVGDILVGCFSSGLLKTTDDGRKWTRPLVSGSVEDIAIDGSLVYLASNTIRVYTDNGDTLLTAYSTAQGLPSNQIESIYVSGATIFAGTSSGIAISTDGGTSFTARTTADGLSNNFQRYVTINAGDYYACNSGGLDRSTDGGVSWTQLRAGACNDIKFGPSGEIYLGAQYGLAISTDGGSSFTLYQEADGLPDNSVNSILIDGTRIYLGTNLGLAYSDDNFATIITQPEPSGLPDIQINKIIKTSDGSFWFATRNGIGRTNPYL